MRGTAQAQPTALNVERLPLVTYIVGLEAPSPAAYVSPQFERLFGWKPEWCLADDDFWVSRIVDSDRPRFLAAFEEMRETHGRMSVEYRVRARDGRLVWVRDIGEVVRTDDGVLSVHGFLTDVTREKELERALAAERAQAEAFFRDSPLGLGITDEEGRYVRVNAALARLTGMSPEEHVGRTLKEIAPHIAEHVAPLLEHVQQTGESIYQQEVDVALPDGEHHMVASFFPIEGDGETHYGRIVTDITPQRQAEADRAAAEQRYRELVEQLPLVTYVNELNPVSNAIYVSPQIEELFGYPAEDWIDDPEIWNRVIHPDDLAMVDRGEQAARDAREPFELEYRIVRSDGTVRWVLDLMETIFAPDGRPLYERGFFVDVTARRENERLFRSVFDNAFEAMLIAGDDGRYVDVNPAACKLYGRSREELLGLRSRDTAADPAGAEDAWQFFLAVGAASGTHVIMRPDGSIRETEFAAKANVLPGRHLSVLRDVTQRRQLERELWRAQRLESVGRLAGGVAHDFNNLLTAVRGYAQLLLARVAPGTDEAHHVTEIDRAAGRAAELTAQLLAFGRRQMLQPRPVELNRLVESQAGLLSRLSGGVITFDLDPDLCATRVDPLQIDQVMVNLVANAADAGGERIVLRTANADVTGHDELADGRYAVLTVEDSGSGIDEEHLEHLFEPFFTTKDVGLGPGLGLATAYGIAKQSGGTIAVASEAGVGSTFSVFLPEARATRAAETGAGERVLVVDADPAARELLYEVLVDAGYRVATVPGVPEAAELTERLGSVDLVVGAGGLSLPKPYTPEDLLRAVRHVLTSRQRTMVVEQRDS
jgi:two-component system, cell cycle sensor histidine kinase and response regulator CckA